VQASPSSQFILEHSNPCAAINDGFIKAVIVKKIKTRDSELFNDRVFIKKPPGQGFAP